MTDVLWLKMFSTFYTITYWFFFTLCFCIFHTGYLLGKFVSDRQHHIRHHGGGYGMNNANHYSNKNQTIVLTNSEYASLKQVRAYNHAKQELLLSARHLGQKYASASMPAVNSQSSLNSQIFNKYISCNQEIPPTTNLSISEFIEQLIEQTQLRHRECIRAIEAVIDENLSND